MIKAQARSASGPVVLLGLSHLNLEALSAHDPIAFPKADVGLAEGVFYMACLEDAPALAAGPDDVVVSIDADGMEALYGGDVLRLDGAELGLAADVTVLVFSGPDEDHMVAMIQSLASGPAPEISDQRLGAELSTHRFERGCTQILLGVLLSLCVVACVVEAILEGKPDLIFIALLLAFGVAAQTIWFQKARASRFVLCEHGVRLVLPAGTLTILYDAIVTARAKRNRYGLQWVEIISRRGERIELPKTLHRLSEAVALLEGKLGRKL